MSKFRRQYPTLVTDLEEIITVSDERMIFVARQSIADVIDNAQTAVAKGGRMRVKTGFLRASGQASLLGMPQGPTRGTREEPDSYAYNEATTESVLGNLTLGATFFFGWTANYAEVRELYDGFLEGAMQHWQRIVAFNTDTIRQRVTK